MTDTTTKSPFSQPWHFDKWKTDEEGDYVKIVGQFVGDWTKDIDTARDIGLTVKEYNKQSYESAANKPSENHATEDSENPYGTPGAPIFSKMHIDQNVGKMPVFEEIIDFLKFDKTKQLVQKFNDQNPNQQLMWHVDNLPGNPRKERIIGNPDFMYQDSDVVRFLIMLEDWEPGQILQFGTIVYTQWKAGTAIAWEWSTLPHLTWNGSWSRRPVLQITGSASEDTWKLITAGTKDTKYVL